MEKEKIYATFLLAYGDDTFLNYDELNPGKKKYIELDKIEKIEYDRPIFIITLK